MSWQPKAGGEGVLLAHPVVGAADVGKYVHILAEAPRKAEDPRAGSEPWFEVRIVGTEPPPHQIYPAYPQSALGPYEVTRESLLDRKATLEANIKSMPTSEKLRVAADLLDGLGPEVNGVPWRAGALDAQAASVVKLALAELEGRLPRVPMPEVPA